MSELEQASLIEYLRKEVKALRQQLYESNTEYENICASIGDWPGDDAATKVREIRQQLAESESKLADARGEALEEAAVIVENESKHAGPKNLAYLIRSLSQPPSDEPCKTCGGDKEIPRPFKQTGYSLGEAAIKIPCPDCKPDEKGR